MFCILTFGRLVARLISPDRQVDFEWHVKIIDVMHFRNSWLFFLYNISAGNSILQRAHRFRPTGSS
jgi:hypothetical protein